MVILVSEFVTGAVFSREQCVGFGLTPAATRDSMGVRTYSSRWPPSRVPMLPG